MKLASQLLPRNPHAKRILPNTFQRSDDLARFLPILPSAPRLIVFTLRRLHSQILALCFHNLTNPFSRNLFIFTSIQNPGGCGGAPSISAPCPLCLCGKSHVLSSLPPLCRLFALFSAPPSFVFNRLRPLFPKHPGWGGSVRHRSQATKPARVPGVPIPTESCQLTADSRSPSGAKGSPHRLGAIRSIDADIFRSEVAGPVARAGRAGVQMHHNGDMVR